MDFLRQSGLWREWADVLCSRFEGCQWPEFRVGERGDECAVCVFAGGRVAGECDGEGVAGWEVCSGNERRTRTFHGDEAVVAFFHIDHTWRIPGERQRT